MPEYRRAHVPGATYFFTVVTHQRRPFLTTPLARACLRSAWKATQDRHPFELLAVSLMPDHLHCLWELPDHDTDYSSRWRHLKARFTHRFLEQGGVETARSTSREKRQERGIWERRFWEHCIRDELDLARHFDYIHYNPVKHGLVQWPEEWPWSTFHRYAREGWYDVDWGHAAPIVLRGISVNDV